MFFFFERISWDQENDEIAQQFEGAHLRLGNAYHSLVLLNGDLLMYGYGKNAP